MTFPVFAGSNPTGYNLTRSLRFRRSAGGYLNRTAGAGNQQIMTLSFWFKRGVLGVAQYIFGSYSNGSAYTNIYIESTDQIGLADAASGTNLLSTQVFRDPSAWYHIVVAIDTTQATAANRVKFYVNNVQITAFASSTYPAQNTNLNLNSAVNHTFFNNAAAGATNYTDGYAAEVNFIGASQLTPSSFGSTNSVTGVWQPARYTGTYGTNGFYLPFTDNSALTTSSNVGLGKDFSGNGNYWATNNISITSGTTYDSMTDVPTLTSATAANFAVLNPLWKGANITLSAANLNASMSATSDASFSSTITITSGKWYWESVITSPSTDYPYIGVATPNFNYQAVGGSCIRSSATGFFKASNATKWNLSSSAYGSSFVANDVMMIAYDADGGKIYFGKNGTWDASSDPAAGTSPAFTGVNAPVTPAGFVYNCSWIMNFGQRPFAYTPPTGFVALNTFNLPTSTIVKGNTVMNANIFTATGGTGSVAVGFQPDFTWIKDRQSTIDHFLHDSVRGYGNYLSSNTTAAAASGGGVTAATSTGFNYSIGNTNNWVSWNWQAGQGTTSTNTNGTITSTVSVNASAGFSVVTYTGISAAGTVGHGLGVAPSFIVVKDRSRAGFNWSCYHSSLGATNAILLNSTNAAASGSSDWNSTAPTSSVFSIPTGGGSYNTNYNGDSFVAYCWTPIAGYSAFGSYTGNGSTDGPFVYTGFKPRYIMMKNISVGGSWIIQDTARNPYNPSDTFLQANTSIADYTYSGANIDFVSNGFKIRGTDGDRNASGYTYIYMAFASNPLKNSLAN